MDGVRRESEKENSVSNSPPRRERKVWSGCANFLEEVEREFEKKTSAKATIPPVSRTWQNQLATRSTVSGVSITLITYQSISLKMFAYIKLAEFVS